LQLPNLVKLLISEETDCAGTSKTKKEVFVVLLINLFFMVCRTTLGYFAFHEPSAKDYAILMGYDRVIINCEWERVCKVVVTCVNPLLMNL